MSYDKRVDGRKFDEPRKMEAKVGVVKRADGSAMFRMGDTIAIAAVYGPRNLYPKFLQDPQKGILRCNYNMLAFSVDERIRPGPSRRSKEISYVTESALSSVLDLSQFPNAVVDVFIEIIQADAGTRCVGITAAAMALADAGLVMRDLIAAVSVGKVGDKIVVDLNKEEEDYEPKDGHKSVDIPVAILPRTGEVSLLQMDGELKAEELIEAIEKAKIAAKKINEVQREALYKKYKEIGADEK
ncbi:exosome complex exonuclease Rrp41 [Candidatus Woesearchaeota archaeon]|nr:exosome complex exonuclease Rrp41 [Candidatus Woesearchaeota archaeon]